VGKDFYGIFKRMERMLTANFSSNSINMQNLLIQ
jgi:hypothetical protein